MNRQSSTLPSTLPADARIEPPSGRVPTRIPAWTGTALRLAVPVALIALILRTVDHGATLDALRAADPASLVLGVLIVQSQIVLSAMRWRFTAGRLGMRLTRRRAVGEYYVATFLNQVLPGGVAGDAIRTWRNRAPVVVADTTTDVATDAATGVEGPTDWPRMLRAVVLERAAGQAVLFVLVAAGLAGWPLLLPGAAPAGAGMLVAIPALAAALLAGVVVTARRARRAATGGRPDRWLRAFADLGPDLRRAFLARRAWAIQLALSVSVVGGYIAVFAIAADSITADALGTTPPPAAWLTVIPLILLAMLVPVTVGGWGWREGAAVVLLPLVGFSPPAALAIAILYGLINLAGSLPGLAVLAATRRNGHTRR